MAVRKEKISLNAQNCFPLWENVSNCILLSSEKSIRHSEIASKAGHLQPLPYWSKELFGDSARWMIQEDDLKRCGDIYYKLESWMTKWKDLANRPFWTPFVIIFGQLPREKKTFKCYENQRTRDISRSHFWTKKLYTSSMDILLYRIEWKNTPLSFFVLYFGGVLALKPVVEVPLVPMYVYW